MGHSNGTYLLARALQDYPWCKFQNVVFAGSVVPTNYPWAETIQRGQIKHLLNYVATADWIVAIFPKAMEKIKWQDLGSAGHDGFNEATLPGVTEIRYIRGAHRSALVEENWDTLARFILEVLQWNLLQSCKLRFNPAGYAWLEIWLLLSGAFSLQYF